MLRHAVAMGTCALLLGCATTDRDRAWVSYELTGRGFESAGGDGGLGRLEGGVDEDDAVAIALARSPAYQADLARIDRARANLDEASRPPNPVLTLLAGPGPVSSYATLLAPLEWLWQMPMRTEAAARQVESVADSLVQSGLDLARDARVAHAERGLAEDRLRVRAQLAATWAELDRIAEARARLGEASPSEAAHVRSQASVAADDVRVAERQLYVARARLRNVLGLGDRAPPFEVTFTRPPAPPPSIRRLLSIAREFRPDVRAAELALRAAAARAGWERSRILSLSAQVRGDWLPETNALAFRGGGTLTLPIFGANPGGIGRADAGVTEAGARLEQVRQRVILEVAEAWARADQAHRSLAAYRTEVLAALEEALRVARRSYDLGEETHVVVLDVLRQIGAARLREIELVAETRRAEAELERAIGARLDRSGR